MKCLIICKYNKDWFEIEVIQVISLFCIDIPLWTTTTIYIYHCYTCLAN